MLIFRLYIALLVIVFLSVSFWMGNIGVLHGMVAICALLFLILDAKQDLDELKQLESELARHEHAIG
jgi:Ca2+/Na+ antiporter